VTASAEELDELLDPHAANRRRALKVRAAKDVRLPEIPYLTPPEDKPLKAHQRVGITWLYLNGAGILADTVGLGKTLQCIGTIALAKSRGELTRRAIVICRPAALLQWRDEFQTFAPRLNVEVIAGDRSNRINRYTSNADVFIIGYQMLLKDIEMLARLDIGMVFTDDVDPIRNAETATANAVKRLARHADKTYVASGTPLQTRLHELYNLLSVVGGTAALGSLTAFERRFIRKELIKDYDPRTGRKRSREVITGYKNMSEFKELVKPWYLRRTHRDLDGADLPEIMSDNVWLDLTPPQQAAYERLQEDVLTILKDGDESSKRINGMAKLMYGSQITAGMAALGYDDTPAAQASRTNPANSSKMDWILDKLSPGGDMASEKAVIFCQFKPTIRAMQKRLTEAGIGYVTFWGEEADPEHRRAIQRKFWEDPKTRICLGTSAMEQSLNLQISRVLINVDMLMNPRRMEQLAGRVRRLGSQHRTVWIYNLLTRGTHEERYLPVLERRQAIGDYVFGEATELFKALSADELLRLIKP
jgi:SNF2 family DNA or RNA helicase